MPSHGHHGDDDRDRSRRRLGGRSDDVPYDHGYDQSRSRPRSRSRSDDMPYYGCEHDHDPSRSRQQSRSRDTSVALPPKAGGVSPSVTSSHTRLAAVPKSELVLGARASNNAPRRIPRGRHVAVISAIPKPKLRVQIVKVPAIARSVTAAVPKPCGVPPTASETTYQSSYQSSASRPARSWRSPTRRGEVIESTIAAEAAAAASIAAEEAATTARHAATAATAAADASDAAAAAAKAASAAVSVMRAARQRSRRR